VELTDLVFTVNPGIEDIVAEEIVSELGGRVEYSLLSGRVYLYGAYGGRYLYERISRLRTVNKALILLWRGGIGRDYNSLLKTRDRLLRELSSVVDYVSPETPFAVQAERIGDHEYTSMDVARVLGDVVIEVTSRHYGRSPPVDLRKPSVIIHAFVRENELIIGVVLTGPWSLHRRGYRLYDHPAALKPTLAAAMLYIAGTMDKQVIIDPMCGGGTIPIEAALMHEDALIMGTDQSLRHIRGAIVNAYAAGVGDRIMFRRWDAREIDRLGLEFDHMILNPPYGIRYGYPMSIRRLYRKFIESASKALAPSGRITMITTEYHVIHRIARSHGLEIVHERTVYHGRLYPHIIVLEKSH